MKILYMNPKLRMYVCVDLSSTGDFGHRRDLGFGTQG